MPGVQRLGDICSSVILDNVHVLQREEKCVEKAIQLLAIKRLNTSILTIVDQRSWMRSLTLRASNLTDEGLARISVLQNLTSLNIAECPNISDAGLIKLKAHNSLCSLDLSKTKVSDEGVQVLASCPKLEVLDLSYTQVGDAALMKFGGHTRLQSLFLRNTRVGNDLFLHWNSNGKCPVALHTLIMPFTRVGDESAIAIAGIPSLALIDLKSTRYSQSGLVALQDGLRRNKGATIKLLPGSKLEVPSAARPAPVSATNTFEWLSEAIVSFALMQGPYAQTQKRTTSPATAITRCSMFGSFSNLSLSSSMGDETPSNQPDVEPTQNAAPARPQPASTVPTLSRIEPPSQLAKPVQSSHPQPAKVADDLKMSVYDDFSSDEDEEEEPQTIIAPKQPVRPPAKIIPSTKSTTNPSAPDPKLAPKRPATKAPTLKAKSATTSTETTVPKATCEVPPEITRKVTPTVPPKALAGDNKENEPSNPASGKRKSPRLQSKPIPKARKTETTNITVVAVPQVKAKRKAATPKSNNKRTKLHHSPTLTYVSPYNTRSSLVHNFVTTPLESIMKKQKKKPPSIPVPLSITPKFHPLLLDTSASPLDTSTSFLEISYHSTDSFATTYNLNNLTNLNTQHPTTQASDSAMSDSSKTSTSDNDTSEDNSHDTPSLANCDLSVINSLADVNLHTSNDLINPTTSMSTTAPLEPTISPPSTPHDINNASPLADTSVVPATPSFYSPPPSPSNALPTPLVSDTNNAGCLTDSSIAPVTASPPSTPTRQAPAVLPEPHTPPPTSRTESIRPATVPRAKPVSLFHSLTPTQLNLNALCDLRAQAISSQFKRTPTTPPHSFNTRTPITPTTPTSRTPTSRPTKLLTSAECNRNKQLNHEFLRMRRLLLY